MTRVKLIFDVKSAAEIAASSYIPDVDEPVYRDDGYIAFGDGVTVMGSLIFKPLFAGGSGTYAGLTDDPRDDQALADYLDEKADRESELLTGGVISVSTIDGTGTLNDIRVTLSTYFILGSGNFGAAQTDFLNIALCSSGNLRWIDIYGTTSNTVVKVEGVEGTSAVHPSAPANSVLFGSVLVTDAGVLPPATSDDCYPIYMGMAQLSPVDSTTYAFGMYNGQNPQPANREVMLAPVIADGTIEKVFCHISSVDVGSSATNLTTMNLKVVDSTTQPSGLTSSVGLVSSTTISSTVKFGDHYFFVTGLSIAVLQGQRLRMEVVCPVYTTNPTNVRMQVAIYVKRT